MRGCLGLRVAGLTAAATLTVGQGVWGSEASPDLVEPASAAPAAQDGCAVPTGEIELTAIEQVEGLLPGVWMHRECGPVRWLMFPGEAGLEFTPDGRFFRVYEDADGTLIRAEGLEQEGTWTVSGVPPEDGGLGYRLEMWWVPWGKTTRHVGVFENPVGTLLLDRGDGYDDRFELRPDATTTAGLPTGLVDPESGCGYPIGLIELTSVEQVEGLFVGVWRHCDDGAAFWAPAEGEVGLEVADDGRFYRVYEDADGTLIRAEGAEQEGTWTALPDYRLEVRLGAESDSVQPAFFENPLTFVPGSLRGRYEIWPDATPVPGSPPQSVPAPTTTPPPTTAPPMVPTTELPPTGPGPIVVPLGSAALIMFAGIGMRTWRRSHRTSAA